jgi:YHS domain-containing protein
VRFALLVGWAVVLVALVLPFVRRASLITAPGAGPTSRGVLRDELVKDPVCQTYIARSRAVTVGASEHARYFCSAECARRFAER